MKVTDYVLLLDDEIIDEVKTRLCAVGIEEELIEDALDSRLCDLSETINVYDLA